MALVGRHLENGSIEEDPGELVVLEAAAPDVIFTQLRIGAAITSSARFDINLSGSIDNSDALFAKAIVASPSRKT